MEAEHPGVSLILTEGRDRVGGNITTCRNEEGYLWEEGPNSFQPNDAMLKAAVRSCVSPHAHMMRIQPQSLGNDQRSMAEKCSECAPSAVPTSHHLS